MKYKIKSEQGFSLVAVLILSSLAGILVINSLKDNVNQERLSGNFQKKLNARLASEQGLFDSITAAQTLISNDPTTTIDDLIASVKNSSGGTTLDHGATIYTIDASKDSGELVLTSVGERFEGEATVKVRLKITPGTSGEGFSTFSDAVVGCEGVSLAGSGQVDSYNSSLGAYSSNGGGHDGIEGHVRTIDHVLGDVNLGGDSPIFGDITATGSIDLDSSDVTGNIHANGDVLIDDGGSVTGNVLAGGDYIQKTASVGGYVDAVGDVRIKAGYEGGIIHNYENRSEAIRYGGTVYSNQPAIDMYGASPFKQATGFSIDTVRNSDSTVDGYDSTNPDTNCDHLNVGNMISIIQTAKNNVLSSDEVLPDFTSRGGNINYDLEEDGLYLTPGQQNYVYNQSPVAASTVIPTTFLGETVNFISYGNFNFKGDTLTVYGDTYLFIDGNFTMSNNARINFTEDSSLTLVIIGKFDLRNNGFFDSTGGNLNPAQSLSIYSSYNSDSTYSGAPRILATDPGIEISGSFDLYAAIYAPLADVNITGSAALYGSVRGKTVNIVGSGDIHYDEALREASQISGTSTSTPSILSFVGFEY